jgi:hypothetical protein
MAVTMADTDIPAVEASLAVMEAAEAEDVVGEMVVEVVEVVVEDAR